VGSALKTRESTTSFPLTVACQATATVQIKNILARTVRPLVRSSCIPVLDWSKCFSGNRARPGRAAHGDGGSESDGSPITALPQLGNTNQPTPIRFWGYLAGRLALTLQARTLLVLRQVTRHAARRRRGPAAAGHRDRAGPPTVWPVAPSRSDRRTRSDSDSESRHATRNQSQMKMLR
jgi:hypothetical protein